MSKKNSKNIVYYPSRKNRTYLKEAQRSSNKVFILLISFSTLLGLLCFILYIQKKNLPSNLMNDAINSGIQIASTSNSPNVGKVQSTIESDEDLSKLDEEKEKNDDIKPVADNSSTEIVKIYQVEPGDTLSTIAEKTGLTVRELREFNQLDGELIVSGQKLSLIKKIESTGERINSKYVVQPGDTLFQIAQINGITIEDIRLVNALNSSEVHPGQELILEKREVGSQLSTGGGATIPSTYVVQKGDNLYRIATNHGTTVEVLQDLNGFSEYTIQIGTTIRIN